LGCVTAQVEAGASPAALLEERRRGRTNSEIDLPAQLLAAPQVERRAWPYKARGKIRPVPRFGRALLRRVVAGKGLPQINAVVDVINLVSVESRLPIGFCCMTWRTLRRIVFRAGRAGETYKGIGKYDLNLEGMPVVR